MRIAVGFVLGTLPGVALMLAGFSRIGLAISILCGLVGAALAVPGVSPLRILIAFLGIGLDRVAPPVGQLVDLDHVDEQIPVQNDQWSQRLAEWLLVPRLERRGGWIVLCGALVGGLWGLAVAVREVQTVLDHRSGQYLTYDEATPASDVYAGGFIIGLAGTVWGGSLAALFASAPFRRSVLFAGGLGAFFSGMVALSATQAQQGNFRWYLFMVPFASIGAGLALLIVGLTCLEKPNLPPDSDD